MLVCLGPLSYNYVFCISAYLKTDLSIQTSVMP